MRNFVECFLKVEGWHLSVFYCRYCVQDCRAAKLSLLNFLSLFRDLQKSTRFSGGIVAEFFRDLQKPARFSGGGGSSRKFPLSSVAKSHFYPPSSDIRG